MNNKYGLPTILVHSNNQNVVYVETPFYLKDGHGATSVLQSEKLNKLNAMFLMSAISKVIVQRFSYQEKATKIALKNTKITLPITHDNKIDFDFMELFIRELEEERVRELEEERVRELQSYLAVAGLSDYTLTEEEQKALNAFDTLEWREFRIGDLYNKLELSNKKFDKRRDTRSEQSMEFSLPLVNAKHGDNGIMFYGRKDIFDSAEMTIDIVQNGAIATGDVYPQLHRTGILWDAYLIKAINHKDTRQSLFFMAASIQKSIKLKFFYEFKATWDRVQNEPIFLPVRDGRPDYDAMEHFISAVQKLVIKDVVQYADRKIAATKQVINNET